MGKNCGNCTVKVWIGAYAGEHTASVKYPSARPRPIARIINMGSVETEIYDLRPGTDTHYDLVFYARPGNGTATWELRPVRVAGDPRPALKGEAKSCGHGPATIDDADFWDCSPHDSQRALPLRTTAKAFSRYGLALASNADEGAAGVDEEKSVAMTLRPGWFGCDGGCCTADYTNAYR